MAHMRHLSEKRRFSECDSHSHGMDSSVSQIEPFMSSWLKPSRCAYETPQNLRDFGSFREPKLHHRCASNCGACAFPAPYNVEEYRNRERLSCHCALYSGKGNFYDGGNRPVAEGFNAGAPFGPMNNEHFRFGCNSADLPSQSSIHSLSPASMAKPLHRNLFSERLGPAGDVWSQGKQVTLHKWFLIWEPNIDFNITDNVNIGVCLGGYTRLGSRHSQLVRTSAVAERLEYSKIRTLDGTEIQLVGCIDEQRTIANGFSAYVTRIFCSGFPCSWRHFLTESSVIAPTNGIKTGAPSGFNNWESANNGKGEYDGAFISSIGTTGDKLRQASTIPSVLCSTLCSEMLREDQGEAAYQCDFGDRISKYSNREGADLDHMNHTNRKEEGYVSSCPGNHTEPKSLSEPYDADLLLDLKRKFDGCSGKLGDLEIKDSRPGQTDDVTCDVDKGAFLDVAPSSLPGEPHTFDESQGHSHTNGAIPTGESLDAPNFHAGVGRSSDTDIEDDEQVGDLSDQPSSTQLKRCSTNVCEIRIDASSHAGSEGKIIGLEAAPALGDVDFISHNLSKACNDHSFEPNLRYSKRLRNEGSGIEDCIKPLDQTSDTGQRVSKRAKSGGKTSRTYRKPIEEEGRQGDCADQCKAVNLQKSINHLTKSKKASAKHPCVQLSKPFVPLGDVKAGHYHQGHPDTAASTQAKTTGESLDAPNFHAGVGYSSDMDIEDGVQIGDLVLKSDQPSSTQLKHCSTNVCEIHVDASSHAELEGKIIDLKAAPALSDADFISHNLSKACNDHSFEPNLRFSKKLRNEGSGIEKCLKPINQTSDTGQRVSKRAKSGGKTSKTYKKPLEEEGFMLSNRGVRKRQGDCADQGKAVNLQKSINHRTKRKQASAKRPCVQVLKPFVPPGDYEAGHYHHGHPRIAASTQAKGEVSRLQEAHLPSPPLTPVQTHKTRQHARYDRNPSEQKQAQSKSIKSRRYKSSILPPPLPPSRVNVSEGQIMRAYGLKLSRRGRLLVPPLAYWRNQTLAHDMDGRIIAILEGFDERPSDTGCYNYKPPVENFAVKLQEELCAAAAEVPNRSKRKRKC